MGERKETRRKDIWLYMCCASEVVLESRLTKSFTLVRHLLGIRYLGVKILCMQAVPFCGGHAALDMEKMKQRVMAHPAKRNVWGFFFFFDPALSYLFSLPWFSFFFNPQGHWWQHEKKKKLTLLAQSPYLLSFFVFPLSRLSANLLLELDYIFYHLYSSQSWISYHSLKFQARISSS